MSHSRFILFFTINLFGVMSSGVNFINVFTRSFYVWRSWKCKKLLNLTVFFELLGSLLVKAPRKNIAEIVIWSGKHCLRLKDDASSSWTTTVSKLRRFVDFVECWKQFDTYFSNNYIQNKRLSSAFLPWFQGKIIYGLKNKWVYNSSSQLGVPVPQGVHEKYT